MTLLDIKTSRTASPSSGENDGHGEKDVFSIKVQYKPAYGRCVVENIPPEEFAYSKQARSISQADYCRWKREVFLAAMKKDLAVLKALMAKQRVT